MTQPGIQRLQLVADVDAGYRSLADLFGSAALDRVIIEGFITAQDAAITLRFGDKAAPPQALNGMSIPSGGGIGVGPVHRRDAGWPMDAIWVRRQSAGAAAQVIVSAVVE